MGTNEASAIGDAKMEAVGGMMVYTIPLPENFTEPDMQSIKDQTTIFEDVAAYWPGVQYNLSGDEGKLPEEGIHMIEEYLGR